MMKAIRTPVVLLGALFVAACGGDAQTEGDVTTEMADGTVATSMSGDAADNSDVALVRVVNAAPDVSQLTIRGDNMQLLPAVNFQNVSDYQSIDNNWNRFEISGANDGTYSPLDINRELLINGYRYTMVVLREEDGGELRTRILRDDISSDNSKAHVRVIHAARGTEQVNVVAQGGETLLGVNYGDDKGFEDVAPWSGTLELRSEDGNRELLALPNINLEAGVSYTIVLTRKQSSGIEAFWFSDRQAPTP